MARYIIRDNRGKRPDVPPQKTFTAVQVGQIGARYFDVLAVNCYTRSEAEWVLKQWRKRDRQANWQA